MVVEPYGPPCVTTYGSANIWNTASVWMTSRKARLRRISGTVIDQNRRHREAPSRSAASYTEPGTACRPASRMMMAKPVVFHRNSSARVGLAQAVEVSQPTSGSPTSPRAWLTRP